jgi:hypothetical protein
MEKLENKTVFKCSYCSKVSLSAGAIAIHEKYCRKNPNYNPPCLFCKHLERIKEERPSNHFDCERCQYFRFDSEVGYDCDFDDCVQEFHRTYFLCKKTSKKMYLYRKISRLYTKKDIIESCDCPMPQECSDFEEKNIYEL